MAQRARFTANYKGVGQILRSQQMQQEMRQVADGVKSRAEAIAPRASGRYAVSFRVEVGVREDGSRAQAKVINDDPIAT